jgi:hypothetical protein
MAVFHENLSNPLELDGEVGIFESALSQASDDRNELMATSPSALTVIKNVS